MTAPPAIPPAPAAPAATRSRCWPATSVASSVRGGCPARRSRGSEGPLGLCGKTSVLEAVQLLAARDQPSLVLEALVRRGEYLLRDGDPNQETDVSRLFRGHRLAPRETFRIRAENGGVEEWVEAEITTTAAQDGRPSAASDHYETLTLDIRWSNDGHLPIPLSPRGGALVSQLQSLRARSSGKARPIWLIDPLAFFCG